MDLAILAAARFPISEPFAGGMEAHTHALAERLTARGHRVTVLAAGGVGRFEVRPMLPVDFAAVGGRRAETFAARPSDVVAEHHSYLEAIAPARLGRPRASSTSTPSTTCRSPAPGCCRRRS